MGVKESRESRVPVGLGEVVVGGELDLWPVRVSHIVILKEVEVGDVDGGRVSLRGAKSPSEASPRLPMA